MVTTAWRIERPAARPRHNADDFPSRKIGATLMGLVNNRAICPNCGGKIHTQARGLGVLLPIRSGIAVRTGTQCQHCGVTLSGKVGLDNKAILAETAERRRAEWRRRISEAQQVPDRPEPTAADRERQRQIHQQAHDRYEQKKAAGQVRADLDARLLALLADGPVTVRDAAARLDASTMAIVGAQTRLGKRVKAKGMGAKRTLRLAS